MTNKVLLIIKDELTKDLAYLKEILENNYELSIITIKDHEQVLNEYTKIQNSISTLIYDHDTQGGISLLQKIFHINPYQKTLIVSNSPYCSDHRGCENCKSHYHKKRIFYPKDEQSLLNEISQHPYNCSLERCDSNIPFMLKPFFF